MCALSVLGAAGLAASAQAPSRLVIEELLVDGVSQAHRVASNAALRSTLRLAPGPRRLEFRFGPTPDAAEQPLRLRFKLDGFDPDWREAGGEMRLSVLALNASSEVTGFFDFPMRGDSAGWAYPPGAGVFALRRERVILPPGTERMRVMLISGGWQPVLGWAAIDDFKLIVTNSQGVARNVWPNSEFETGVELDQPDGYPQGWQRGGFGASMARVLRVERPLLGHALLVADDNVRSYCEWRMDLPLQGMAKSGDALTLEWKELFSVGEGGVHAVNYGLIPPGDYVFQVMAASPEGALTTEHATLAISIPTVFWKTPGFLTLAGLTGAGALATWVRHMTRRRLQRRLEQLEQQRALERERSRIAQDIHDDLGARLTRINLLSQSALSKIQGDQPALEETQRIRALANDLTRTLDEVVWAVDPRHDTLDSLVAYLADYTEGFLDGSGTRPRFEWPIRLPPGTVAAGIRHNLFLAFKEALNNVAKHAKASEVRITLDLLPGGFRLALADNGVGFEVNERPSIRPAAEPSRRRGLENLRHRIETSGGRFEIASTPGTGTTVRFTVFLDLTDRTRGGSSEVGVRGRTATGGPAASVPAVADNLRPPVDPVSR